MIDPNYGENEDSPQRRRDAENKTKRGENPEGAEVTGFALPEHNIARQEAKSRDAEDSGGENISSPHRAANPGPPSDEPRYLCPLGVLVFFLPCVPPRLGVSAVNILLTHAS